MKTTENNVFDITLKENLDRVERLSRNRVPWHLRMVGNVERWMLENIYKLDPTAERIVRFYTYNDEKGEDYDFKCPNYTYDLMSCLYDDFVEVAHEIGKIIQTSYGIAGRYYYDVKITLIYEKVGNPLDGEEWDMRYTWKILGTDNPRCVAGNPFRRKDCYYLNNFNSKLTIEGYTLSGNYRELADVLNDLVNKTIIIHSTQDARALFRIMKFLGVKTVMFGNNSHYNSVRRALFNKTTFSYRLDRIDNCTTLMAVRRRDLSVSPQEVLDIDEFIVRRSIKARLKDLGGK